MNNTYYLYLYSILFLLFPYSIYSQTYEAGCFLGRSLFHGDIGYNNAEYSLVHTQSVLGVQVKRNLNHHFSIDASIKRGSISANDAYSTDVFALERNLHFRSKITEIGVIAEFNFRPYLSYDPKHNHTPFVFSGITRFFFNPQSQHPDGNWYSLRPLATEGQGSDAEPARKLYDLHGTSIPFGIGYKFNIFNFITLNCNISWRITFTDYLDDVSKTYVDPSMSNQLGNELANQSDTEFSNGFQRGNPYNNDKYGFFGISIMYSIKDPKSKCSNLQSNE
jgi:hypothetical protein